MVLDQATINETNNGGGVGFTRYDFGEAVGSSIDHHQYQPVPLAVLESHVGANLTVSDTEIDLSASETSISQASLSVRT